MIMGESVLGVLYRYSASDDFVTRSKSLGLREPKRRWSLSHAHTHTLRIFTSGRVPHINENADLKGNRIVVGLRQIEC